MLAPAAMQSHALLPQPMQLSASLRLKHRWHGLSSCSARYRCTPCHPTSKPATDISNSRQRGIWRLLSHGRLQPHMAQHFVTTGTAPPNHGTPMELLFAKPHPRPESLHTVCM